MSFTAIIKTPFGPYEQVFADGDIEDYFEGAERGLVKNGYITEDMDEWEVNEMIYDEASAILDEEIDMRFERFDKEFRQWLWQKITEELEIIDRDSISNIEVLKKTIDDLVEKVQKQIFNAIYYKWQKEGTGYVYEIDINDILQQILADFIAFNSFDL